MEQLYVFGTGNAAAIHCYNTCFALKKDGEYFMVDAGGGNGILKILDDMDVDLSKIHNMFVTHEHTDHLLGVVWLVRFIATRMKNGTYEGDFHIYCHDELPHTIDTICHMTLQGKFAKLIGERIHLIPVHDGQTVNIMGYDMTFFDIHSTKAKQFGFTTTLENGKKLTCAGDEPYNPLCAPYAEGSDWLLHEAFCLYADREKYKPYEKHHSTALDACKPAEELQIPNLVLWHTEDKTGGRRKELYTKEGQEFYHGNLYVPEDEEILEL